tara:strand:+ start:118 stop:543 length:426 start_codon:yes stop_codon:yes gene_type:complete
MTKRLKREKYFMSIAELAAARGTCPRAQVGCVIVDRNNRIKATGYNSSNPGQPHCEDGECIIVSDHCIRTIHAEVAAVLNLERNYDKLIAYVTHEPCIHCYKVLTAAGVKTIFYKERYGNMIGEYYKLRKEIGVPLYCTDD